MAVLCPQTSSPSTRWGALRGCLFGCMRCTRQHLWRAWRKVGTEKFAIKRLASYGWVVACFHRDYAVLLQVSGLCGNGGPVRALVCCRPDFRGWYWCGGLVTRPRREALDGVHTPIGLLSLSLYISLCVSGLFLVL